MALTSCTPPAKGSPLFELGDDEMEMGVGIHGEPGRRREKLATANAIVDELLEAVVSDLPFSSGDDVALMINGLGGTPISELYLLYGHAHEELAKRGINVRRNYVGEYCTSLDMAGMLDHAQPARPRDRRAAGRAGRDRDQDVLRGSVRPGSGRRAAPTGCCAASLNALHPADAAPRLLMCPDPKPRTRPAATPCPLQPPLGPHAAPRPLHPARCTPPAAPRPVHPECSAPPRRDTRPPPYPAPPQRPTCSNASRWRPLRRCAATTLLRRCCCSGAGGRRATMEWPCCFPRVC